MNQCPHCGKPLKRDFTKLLTIPEAVEQFGFASVGTFRKYIESGRIPVAIRIGRRVYLDPRDLQNWIDEQKEYKKSDKLRILRDDR